MLSLSILHFLMYLVSQFLSSWNSAFSTEYFYLPQMIAVQRLSDSIGDLIDIRHQRFVTTHPVFLPLP